MPEFLHIFIDFVGRYPHISCGAVFLVAFTESLALVGLVVPGAVLMVATGFLVSTGAVSLGSALLSAVLGAVAGDGLSYVLGRYYREALASRRFFQQRPEVLERGRRFFRRYGGKSVLLGRFFGPVRPVVPLVAGMLHMSAGKFFVINILSAPCWALAYILPGVVFGASFHLAAAVTLRLGLLFVLGFCLVGGGVWLAGHILRRLDTWFSPCRKWLLLAMVCGGALAGWMFIYSGSLEQLGRVFTQPPIRQMKVDQWLKSGWQTLPVHRVDLRGKKKTPLILQWSGSPDILAGVLRGQGWREARSGGVRSWLMLLLPEADVMDLPVFPCFHNGRPAARTLIKGGPERRRLLYLWPTEVRVEPGGKPLYVAAVEQETRTTLAGFITFPVVLGAYEGVLSHDLVPGRAHAVGAWQRVRRPAHQGGGEILLGVERLKP